MTLPKIGSHECSHRCKPDENTHVSIVYPGEPGKPSKATPYHLKGQSLVWEGVRAEIVDAEISLEAPPCAWDPLAPGYKITWRQLSEVVE